MIPTSWILVPTGALGLDFPDLALGHGIALRPERIVMNAKSTDSSLFYRSAGTSKIMRPAFERDWA